MVSGSAEGADEPVGSWLPGLDQDLLNPPRQQRSRRSMAQVLAAAETIWIRDGPDGITMAAISEESGISIGAIYSRFNGKQGLVRAVKDRLLTRLEHDIAERLHEHGGSLEHTVRELVTCLADADLRTLSRPLGAGHTHDEELDARGRAAREKVFAAFRATALRNAGDIRHGDPELALSMVFHIVISSVAAVPGPPGGRPESPKQVREEIVHVCLAYLRDRADAGR